MKRLCVRSGTCVLSLLLFVSAAVNASETKLHYGRFGTITLYQKSVRVEGGAAWKGLQLSPRKEPPLAMDRFSGRDRLGLFCKKH